MVLPDAGETGALQGNVPGAGFPWISRFGRDGIRQRGSAVACGRIAAGMLILPELERIHEVYLSLNRVALEHFGRGLGGKLLFRSALDADGIAAVVAGSVAGAASLCADDEAARVSGALRNGLCDFVVSNLNEALRILKNELRRSRPVSVCLKADPRQCIEELVERGLQPDLISVGQSGGQNGALMLKERGAVPLLETDPAPAGTSLLVWSVAAEPARRLLRISRLAGEALDPARSDTAARRRWLEAAPRQLGRSFGNRQCLRMAEAEIPGFLQRLHSEALPVSVLRDGEAIPIPRARG